jgi:hypothetical protein
MLQTYVRVPILNSDDLSLHLLLRPSSFFILPSSFVLRYRCADDPSRLVETLGARRGERLMEAFEQLRQAEEKVARVGEALL